MPLSHAAADPAGARPSVPARLSPQPAAPHPRRAPLGARLADAFGQLENPADVFSGARLEEALFAQNIVVFKRTSPATLRPRGVTHNYHHRFALVLPLHGAGRVHVDGTAHPLQPEQALLIFPHQFHYYLDVAADAISWLFITFELARPQSVAPLRDSPRVLEAAAGELLHTLLQAHVAEPPGADRHFRLIIRVSELLRCLLAAPPVRPAALARSVPTPEHPQGRLLHAINRSVRAHLHRQLTLADLARHTGYSSSHLRAVFRREFGVSLGSYIRDSRLSLAAARLSGAAPGSIARLARACGFVSIFAFSRAFKKALGRSPSAYRKFVLGLPEPGGRRLNPRT